MRNWVLPDQIEDVLPGRAWQMERIRRSLLDGFDAAGYDLVAPPLVEFLDSLLTGAGADLDAQTFKLTDPLSGRLLGIRADITPQTARIDAHLLAESGVTRLCYAGQVLQARPSAMHHSRQPYLVGAELYGDAGIAADLEVLRLLVRGLAPLRDSGGLPPLLLDFGHAGIFRALLADAPAETVARLLPLIASKQADVVAQVARGLAHADALAALCRLYGGVEVLDRAAAELPPLQAVQAALAAMRQVAEGLAGLPVALSCDLGELRGFSYHSGLVFSVYAQGGSDAIANGGRYDEVGRAFGRARPATGFSIDLKELVRLLPPPPARARGRQV
ncbi:MAG: ATP phosphoribosyltransferase regulatory subunit [Rhodocyclaceae bacterium]|nr:ATP phosphoribosyltransferase regulatory subunit [Rhodocyclaceae bacterium]